MISDPDKIISAYLILLYKVPYRFSTIVSKRSKMSMLDSTRKLWHCRVPVEYYYGHNSRRFLEIDIDESISIHDLLQTELRKKVRACTDAAHFTLWVAQ